MIKNLAITIPTLGAIRLGEVAVDAKGRRLPVRLNHFMITGLFRGKDQKWVKHPMHTSVANEAKVPEDKVTEIPIRLMFNNESLNIRSRYEAYDEGRLVCAGNGETARRRSGENITDCKCPGAEFCEFGKTKRCDLFGRLNVQIEGQDDPFSSFILRTKSVNSVNALTAKINNMAAFFGNRLVGLPLKLKLRQKATAESYWTPFWFADIVLATDIFSAAKAVDDYEKKLAQAGISQAAYEQTVLAGFDNGPFEESFGDLGAEMSFDEDAPAEGPQAEEPAAQQEGAEVTVEKAFSETADDLETDVAPSGLAGLRAFLENQQLAPSEPAVPLAAAALPEEEEALA
ncbi:hydrolase or metal-binding protein [Azonexus hydrophilus]|uniref:Hydrolase or metal-binding protein n=1 Tax=Azonexus hydrophilus TaxID=418702 RepID=A0ABZ2XMS5_9RHOO